jgi:hypothetical protein
MPLLASKENRIARVTLPCVLLAAVLLAVVWFGVLVMAQQSEPAKTSTDKPLDNKPRATKVVERTEETKKELFSGKVVLLQEALKQRGVKAFDEFKSQVVLETDAGELIPLVPDWRGRAFFQDERLRDRQVDLVGTRHKAAPYLQVLMIFVFDEKGTRHYMDYWCDVCSIPMHEIKPCDCCQADIRLRLQRQELPTFVKPKP